MLKKNDFIEIEYTGKTDDGLIFDTTDEKLAEESGIKQENANYGKVIICLGQGHLIEGLDDELTGKEPGEHTVALEPERAFGKKSAKLVQLIPTSKFKQHNIIPQPGLQVNIDNLTGIIKTVSGGRTLVDFNHPLSGKMITYSVNILRKIENDNEKLKGYLKLSMGKEPNVEIKEGKASISANEEIPKEMVEEFSKKIKELIPTIKEVEFVKKEEKAEKKG